MLALLLCHALSFGALPDQEFQGDRRPAVPEEFSSLEAEPVDLDLDLAREPAPPQTDISTALDVE